MHDLESNPVPDDSAVKVAHPQPAEERLFKPLAEGLVTTERTKLPRAWQYSIAGGIVLLVLAVIFGSVLSLGHHPARQASPSGPPSETKPSYLPTPSDAQSGLFPYSGSAVLMTIADDVAYVGTADQKIYALRISNARLLWRFHSEAPC